MEFDDVLRRRRMVRRFTNEPVAAEHLQRLVSAALRGPSAGFTQGFTFLVLQSEKERALLWGSSPDPVADDVETDRHMRSAPLVIVPMCSEQAYIKRYSEPDKAVPGQEPHWRAPVWYLDTAFASMLVLLQAVDLGLGAVFIAPPQDFAAFRRQFGVPGDYFPIGMILAGHRPAALGPSHDPARRKPQESSVFYGRYGAGRPIGTKEI
jgi:nitroreductase